MIGFMEKSEPLRLIFDSLASETALTMAEFLFSYRHGNKSADVNVFGSEIRKFFLRNSFGYRDDINYFHINFRFWLIYHPFWQKSEESKSHLYSHCTYLCRSAHLCTMENFICKKIQKHYYGFTVTNYVINGGKKVERRNNG